MSEVVDLAMSAGAAKAPGAGRGRIVVAFTEQPLELVIVLDAEAPAQQKLALGVKYVAGNGVAEGDLFGPKTDPVQRCSPREGCVRLYTSGTACGQGEMQKPDNRKIDLSTVLAGQNVGIKEVSDDVWLVTFMHYDLGFFDNEADRLTSVENPFDAEVSPQCLRNNPLPM